MSVHAGHAALVRVTGQLIRADASDARPTLSLFVLDSSDSMERFGTAPLEAVNAYLKDLKAAPTAASIAAGVITFADAATMEIAPQPVAQVPLLTRYEPNGFTYLYGTVRETLDLLLQAHRSFEAEHRIDLGVVMGIVTDGLDNKSPEQLDAVKERVAEANRRGFNFLVFGLGVSAEELAMRMGMTNAQVHTMAATPESVHRAARGTSRATTVTSMGRAVTPDDPHHT